MIKTINGNYVYLKEEVQEIINYNNRQEHLYKLCIAGAFGIGFFFALSF